MGYHITKIEKGELGKVSKITEEYEEFLDAVDQGANIMAYIELSDLLGAIEAWLIEETNGSLNISDLIKMKDLTKSAFQDGSRK